MIIDLEQEKSRGLDEAKLDRDVMKLMGLSETCEGPVTTFLDTSGEWASYCTACGDEDNPPPDEPHPRIPKPLAQVRDELIEWLQQHCIQVSTDYFAGGVSEVSVGYPGHPTDKPLRVVRFTQVTDFALALALAAVRLLGEKL